MTIVRKVNKKGHAYAYQKLENGKLKRIAWAAVHARIRAGLPVAFVTKEIDFNS